MRIWALAAICLCGAPALLSAEDGTVVGELELYGNFETLSVYAFYSGDGNSDNSARMEYREAGGRWRQGHELTRIYGNQWTGSVFRLSPASEYEVRVRLDDADGIDRKVLEGKVTTRDDRWAVGGGKTIYVSPGGDGDGTEDSPLGSISAAVAMAEPGDTVLVGAGVYREAVVIRKSGEPGAWIHVKGEEGAILDGSDAGFLDREGPYRWSSVRSGRRGSTDDFVAECDWEVDYVAIKDEKLYGYGSLDEMRACRSGAPGGWYQDREAGKLYVHVTESYCNPNHSKTAVSRLATGVLLDGSEYVVVDGLEVRYFGKYGIHVNGSNNVVQNCRIHHEDVGIHIYSKDVDNTTIQDCEVSQTGVWRWPWHMTKATRYEVDAIGARAGRGTVVRRNEVSGSFDGIGLSVWEALREPGWMQDTDINDNHIYDIGDDGCEPEGTCTNLRFWGNRIHGCLMVQSIAPVTVGPCYFINETYYDARLGVLKIKVRTSGVVYLYNCTFAALGWRQAVWDYGGRWDNLHFRNCIFYGTDGVFGDDGGGKENVTFDYNCLYTTLPGRFLRWRGKEYGDIEEFRADGYEEHGISADPKFVDADSGDFRLEATSPAIDRGVEIPGINEGFVGAAPDMGSHEFAP